jgi:hypothetical protein
MEQEQVAVNSEDRASVSKAVAPARRPAMQVRPEAPPSASAAQFEINSGAYDKASPSRVTAEVAGKVNSVQLPSGLKAVSTAASGTLTLAIDATGSLYLWQDSGNTWQPVASQWTGRAVQLHVVPLVRVDSATSKRAPGTQQPSGGVDSSSPSSAFEIVNDKKHIWTSTNGRTWTAR